MVALQISLSYTHCATERDVTCNPRTSLPGEFDKCTNSVKI